MNLKSLNRLMATAALFSIFCFSMAHRATAQATTGAGNLLVHSKFGGQIFGFDIDQNGTEGVLSESQTLNNGKVVSAVETFDQKTGEILKVLIKTETQDDFITRGIVGNSVGLVEREHLISFLHVKRTFRTINPIGAGKFTGLWTPPFQKDDLVSQVSRSQGVSNVAVFAFKNGGDLHSFVFSSNVAANTSGPFITLRDPRLSFFNSIPVMAYDSAHNRAVFAAFDHSPLNPPAIGLVDLSTGKQTVFTGVGVGRPNGIAVDSGTGIACTTTTSDNGVQFYNLSKHSGISETLPGANNPGQFGSEVAVDPINHLFFVAQERSSTQANSSAIYVYDEKGILKQTFNGFSFNETFNITPTHIALNPSQRSGFVDGPDPGVTDIQSFTY